MNRVLSGALIALSALGLSSCGMDLSGSSRQSQQNLPDAGLWLCRVDFSYFNPNPVRDFITDFGQGRERVKDEITRTCLSSFTVRMEACSRTIQDDDFKCIHESQISAPADEPGIWQCQLDYSYDDGFAGSRNDRMVSSKSSRSAAIEDIFYKCGTSYTEKKNGCSRAILNGALVCSVM